MPPRSRAPLRRSSRRRPRAEEPERPDGPPWFEDVTDRVGLNFVHDPGDVSQYHLHQCVGSGCTIADLDGDGLPDLVLLTSAGPGSKSTNKLYRQKRDGTFEDVSVGSGLDFPGPNLGISIGDVNNDGKPDILITQVNGARVLLNRGGMKFVDVTAESGLKNPMWGTSVAAPRLRPRRLARRVHRELRGLRPGVAVYLRDRRARLLHAEGVPRHREQAVPQPRRRAGQ